MSIPVTNCSSCGACANVCSRSAISMRLDKNGFYRPVINSSKCIQCGACERVCPWTKDVENPNGNSDTPQTFAAYTKNEDARRTSSSGGLFSVLAEAILDAGGVVVGVAKKTPTRYSHVIVETKSDLSRLRGSKYVQADVGDIYREVRSVLKAGRKVLFSGVPCQVAALYSVLGSSKYENLFTVDVVCHGVPSVKVYESFIQSLEKKQGSRVSETVFREKSSGWTNYSLTHFFVNGKKIILDHVKSDYMAVFLSRICQNDSCAECRYRKLPRIADISLGDYWGVSRHHPQMDDNKGTSVVLLNNEHGVELFNAISKNITYCESRIEYAVEGNPCIVRSGSQHPRKLEFFKDLNSLDFDSLRKKYCPLPPWHKRLYRRTRGLLGKIKRKLLG